MTSGIQLDDLQVGGRYKLFVMTPSGQEINFIGKYTECKGVFWRFVVVTEARTRVSKTIQLNDGRYADLLGKDIREVIRCN